MGAFVHWLTIEELEKLEAHKLALLKAAIEREIAHSKEFQELLEKKMRPVYDRMVGHPPSSPPGGAASAPPAPSGSTTPGAGSGPSGPGGGTPRPAGGS